MAKYKKNKTELKEDDTLVKDEEEQEVIIEEMPKMETEEVEEMVQVKENSFKQLLKQETQKEIED